MRIEGTITKIFDLKEGVSKATGVTWYSRDIAVSWREEVQTSTGVIFTKDHSIVVALRGENAKNFTLHEGTRVGLHVSFVTNEFNGRLIQNIYCTSIYVN